jgi:hypothetical protein
MNDYATLAELKGKLDITDTNDDSELQSILAAVSRVIDEIAGRFFYRETQTRYYSAESGDYLQVDDLVSVTTLSTDENDDRVYERTWVAADYDLWPYNAALHSKPYNEIQVAPTGSYSFPTGAKSISLTAVFGWPAVPNAIKEACLLWSERIWKRRDAIFGVMGSIETGMIRISGMDPDVERLLQPYVKLGIYGV